jgi:glycosyl transferase, family 25
MRINVISLERTPERFAEFCRLNGHLKDVRVFQAVDGLWLCEDDLAARGFIVPPVHYNLGALGGLMSHIALWDHAAATGEITTICEDDAIFNLQFDSRAFELLTMLPNDTDIVYWGWNFDAQAAVELIPGMSPCAAGFGRNPLPAEARAFQSCLINPTAYRLLRAFGIMCYTVTPNGARRLRSMCLPIRNEVWDFPEIRLRIANVALDVGMCNALTRIRAFCSLPPLVISLNDLSQSTIQSQVIPNRESLKPEAAICPSPSAARNPGSRANRSTLYR